MRKTKIICTLGPATDAVLPEMIKAGMNVARMNFSHGSHEEHKARMDAVKAARKELGMPVGIMLDTKGPEIRTKTYKDGKIEIVEGQEFTLTTRDIEGDNTIVSITYEGLPNDVQPGTRILIDIRGRGDQERHRHCVQGAQRRPALQPQVHQRTGHQAEHEVRFR